MASVVDCLPVELQTLFIEIIGANQPKLLESLMANSNPTSDEISAVQDVLSFALTTCIQSDGEPDERGKSIDELIGSFVMRWLIE